MPPKNQRIYDAFAITKDGTTVPIKDLEDIELSDLELELERIEYRRERHGSWIECKSSEHWKCEACGHRAPMWDGSEWLSEYCPHCGAKMEGGGKR